MSANARRGEVEAMLDGRAHRLCLTLGALAELEQAFKADDLGALVARFATGKLTAWDMMRIIGAGLRGAGAHLSDEEVGQMRCEEGIAGFAGIVSELLTATFGGGAAERDSPPNP